MAILFYTADLMFSPKLSGAAAQLGVQCSIAASAEKLLTLASEAPAEAVVLDLSTPGLRPQEIVPMLRALPNPPRGIIAYGPHVQEARLAAATEAGCDAVLSRGQFNAQMLEVLRRYVRAE